MKIVIVGGVAGGASTAARLRRLDEKAEIIMLERGGFISFANCGLPYYIGGEIKDKEKLTVMTPNSFKSKFDVDVRIFSEAVAIDRAKKLVTIKDVKTGKSYDESYDKLVLSPGAEPVKPPIDGVNSERVFTLRNIPDTFAIKNFVETAKPKKAFVVGGGFIGIEIAENLVAAGVQVTLAELSNQLLAPLDYDTAVEVHNHIRAKGVNLLLGAALQQISPKDASLEITAGGNVYDVDFAVLAIGVKPDSHLARDSGLECNARGGIKVNKYMQTSDPDIYAAGDAVEITDFITEQPVMVPLAGPANRQGRIAADNICGIPSEYKGVQGSSILKVFDMTAASTGINEKTAQKLGLNYEKSFTYSANHATYYPGAVNMAIKTIFDKDSGRILGAQVVGYDGTDKRADVFATAIRAKMTANDLTELELCYAPPYSSAKDPVNMAGYVIENIMSGRVKIYHWHDIEALWAKDDVTLLDTRTVAEYENGHIDKYINIPVDELRSRLGELDKSKPVYITCQIGLRGYIAARILSQNSFDVYNLSGGYRLYNAIFCKTLSKPDVKINTETQTVVKQEVIMQPEKAIKIDACGLQCPGPVVKLAAALKAAQTGEIIQISTTDPAFAGDVEGFCRRTGNEFLGMSESKGVSTANIRKVAPKVDTGCQVVDRGNNKNFIVFSGDLDKAIASFIMANAAAAMGRHTEMFFTFWGLNILRKPSKVKVQKTLIERMFGKMMPRGSLKLGLSKMNMGGMGTKLIRGIMNKKNVDSLEDLMKLAMDNGVKLLACSMSMDVMGIKREELIDGIEIAGAARMLANAEESDMSLFI